MMISKELQDLVWSILPKEFKEEVRRCYQYALKSYKDDDMQRGALDTFEHLFGEHNLTSDAESEEMLTVPRKKVQLLYKAFRDEEAELNRDNCRLSVSGLASVRAFDYFALFGEKCLPDKKPGPDLAKLKGMLDKSLASETKESLNAWLDEQEKKGLSKYRIKHIPTGLYYKPGEVNLSANGKVYTTAANVLTRACRGVVRLTVHKDSRLHKATKNEIKWEEAGYQCDVMIAHVPITEFEKEGL